MWELKPIKIKEDIINKGIEKFNKKREMLQSILSKIPQIPKRDLHNNKFDARDIFNMSMLLDIKGNSEEEIYSNYEKEVKKLASTFIEGDFNKKKEYLEMIYSKYDKFVSYKENGVNTEDEFVELSGISQLGQTITTLRDSNQRFFFNRYNTEEKQKQMLTSMLVNDVVCGDLAIFRDEHKDFNLDEGITNRFYNGENFNVLRSFTDAMVKAQIEKSNTITIGITNEMLEEANKPLNEIAKSAFIGGVFLTHGSVKSMLNYETKENTIRANNYQYMYLNGENLGELAKKALIEETGQNPTPGDIIEKSISMYYNALTKGDKAISIAVPVYENGQSKISLMDIKPNAKDLETIENAKHSKFRLMFFNWGPFRIKPNKDSIDKLYSNNKFKEKAISKATELHNQDVATLKDKYDKRPATEKEEEISARNESASKFLQNMLNISMNDNTNEKTEISITTSQPQKIIVNDNGAKTKE